LHHIFSAFGLRFFAALKMTQHSKSDTTEKTSKNRADEHLATGHVTFASIMQRQAEAPIPSRYGQFRMLAYADKSSERMPHIAFVAEGFDSAQQPVAVRIHSECMTGDVFGSRRCDCGEQLEASLRIAAERNGVVIYLRQEGRGIGLINKLKAYQLQDLGLNTAEANTHLGFDVDARQYDAAVAILQDLDIQSVELITNNPDKVEALRRSPVRVAGRIPLVIAPQADNRPYLQTKQDLMGHLLGL
jgi:3,4-dihydroxy 2-butanone 4-phosphate synthase/GTP cyclohydrolase II